MANAGISVAGSITGDLVGGAAGDSIGNMVSSAGNTMLNAGMNHDFSNVGRDLANTTLQNGGLDLIGNGVSNLVGNQFGDQYGQMTRGLIQGAGGAALNSLSTGNNQGLGNQLASAGVQATASILDAQGVMSENVASRVLGGVISGDLGGIVGLDGHPLAAAATDALSSIV